MGGTDRPPEDTAEVWIGLVEVRPLPGCMLLGGASGAYTHLLAMASSEAGWVERARSALTELRLKYVESEDVQPLLMRRLDDEVTKDVRDVADDVRRTGGVRLTPFHVWR